MAVPKLKILYEDKDVLVVEKPAGLLVHPTGAKREEETLVDAVRTHFPGIDGVGEDPTRPGIVHRLDKDVSGVMVVAKSQAMFKSLKAQFTGRDVEKEYLALVYGKLPKDTGTINFKLARSKAHGRMTARSGDQEGKEAITHYEVIERFKTATFVRVHILTGRTHQIRAHFKGLGYPLIGDTLYQRRKIRNIRPIPLDRVFLHAHKLTITLPDGLRKTFESPLPDTLKQLMETLPRL
jgi:23S rRNA pseudouridine1911/1915/1917 synthase